MTQLATTPPTNHWLASYKKDVFSQFGEDGILEKILEILGIDCGWCLEIGAWDGTHCSNTRRLIKEKNWSAVLIEGNRARFRKLQSTYKDKKSVHPVLQFVGLERENGLDSVLSRYPIPQDFDLASIDIDGNDFYLWEALKKYCPKVVIIEFNQTIPNCIDFVQPKDIKVNQGNSLAAFIRLGKEKGYELIATTENNAIFVRKEYFPLFNIENNSIDQMHPPSKSETYIFQLFDGSLAIRGNTHLLWSELPILEKRVQALPKILRYYETNNILKKMLRKIFKFLINNFKD